MFDGNYKSDERDYEVYEEDREDPWTRYKRNPDMIEIEKKIKGNKGIKILDSLLELETFTVLATKFRLRESPSDGYDIDGEVVVTFRKSKKKYGILKNDDESRIWIYHNGIMGLNGDFPRLCPYIFLKRSKDSEEGPDIDAINHVKILFNDIVFEDFVHDASGIIISNSELIDTHSG